MIAVTAHAGLTVGLFVTALGLGFRHGIDWDHIAAISDIAGSQETPRASLFYATCYFAGHGLVIAVLGIVAIVASEHLPDSIDIIMERVVGTTLLILGLYIVVSLFRKRRDFRMRSRWMLVIAGLRRLTAALRPQRPRLEPDVASSGSFGFGQPHVHHVAPDATSEPLTAYGVGAATGIGVLHGIGAETPTQVLLLAAASSTGSAADGILLLGAFLVGLLGANTLVASASALGFLSAARNFVVYAAISILTGVASILVGVLLISGRSNLLPSLLGG